MNLDNLFVVVCMDFHEGLIFTRYVPLVQSPNQLEWFLQQVTMSHLFSVTLCIQRSYNISITLHPPTPERQQQKNHIGIGEGNVQHQQQNEQSNDEGERL